MDPETERLVRILKALSDPNRLEIMNLLSDSELCACRILETLNITQPTLSHHMKVLSDAGLVDVHRHGRWSHYSVNTGSLDHLKAHIVSLGSGGIADGTGSCPADED